MTLSPALPALRRKIFKYYAAIVALFGIISGLLVVVLVFVATGLAPAAIHRNYDSIEAARRMQEAWDALDHGEEYPSQTRAAWERQFESALGFERNNITEPGEKEAAEGIQAIWRARTGTTRRSLPATLELHGLLATLVRINEEGMFRYVNSAHELRRNVVFAAFLLVFAALVLTLYLSDTLAGRLAFPLRAIAEALRSKPQPGHKLKLPVPTSLEIKILNEELSSLWTRISRSEQLNVEEIERQRKSLLTLLTAVEDAILVLDASDVVMHVNKRMTELIGVSEAEILGRSWPDLPSSSENYLKLREILRLDLPESNSFELQTAFGKPRVYAARARLVHGAAGREPKIFLLHDITELKQRERLKTEFVGVLSHELKTPLQSLSTASDLLCEAKGKLDERTKLLAETIAEDVARVRSVANEFVQVSELTSGAIRVRPETRDLSELLPQWIKPFQMLAAQKQVTIDFINESGHSLFVRIDPVRFSWVLSNLLSNAVRVAPSGSRVEIRLAAADGKCEIAVMDSGPGIAEEVRRRMFDPYFKGGAEASKFSGTMGMGLTIAKEITEAHDGAIVYEALKPTGSRFRVLLPAQG